MVQTVRTLEILTGEKVILLEKPHILQRIFFSVMVLTGATYSFDSKMSFDDPLFHSFYTLNGPHKFFKASGPDIFQGNVWVFNNSNTNLVYTATEILH